MPVNLSYDIPKNQTKSLAAQIAEYLALQLEQQGELDLLNMIITSDTVTDLVPGDPNGKLRRDVTLTEAVPAFVNAFGPSEDATQWGLSTLWQQRIEQALHTVVTIPLWPSNLL